MSEMVKNMYFSKNWDICDELKSLTIPEINDICIDALMDIKDVNLEEYNKLAIHIKLYTEYPTEK